jgi:hypothetical protein
MDVVEQWQRRVDAFARVAHDLLARHETSKSRVVSLTATWRRLGGLSLLQDALLKDSLLCVERGVQRAAHVMAWAAFMDLLEEKLASDGFKALHVARPKWKGYTTLEALRESVVEYQLIDAARDVGLLSKPAAKTLHGLLSKRNECAHPTGYDPSLNEALGYVSELLTRMATLQAKSLRP